MVCLMRIHAVPLRMEIAGAAQWQDVHCVLKGTHFEASNELNSEFRVERDCVRHQTPDADTRQKSQRHHLV